MARSSLSFGGDISNGGGRLRSWPGSAGLSASAARSWAVLQSCMSFSFGGVREKLAGGGLAVLVLLAYPTVAAWFERPPIELVGTPQTEITAAGKWRVTRTIRIREVCGSAIWDRAFKDSGEAEVRRVPAAAASEGMGLEPIQGGRPAAMRRAPGVYTSWWEYDVVPGRAGSYVVNLSPGWCPSGWSRTYNVFSVPFDWRAGTSEGHHP